MSNKKISLILFIIIILGLNVLAVEDFSLTVDQKIDSICPSSTGLYTLVVENTGDKTMQFTVSTTGDAAVWSTSVPLGFVLNANEKKNVYTYITPKLNAKSGQYNLRITVSSGGKSKSVDYIVDIKDCFKVDIKAKETEKSLCPGDIDSFTFTVTNDGQFSEKYELSVEGSATSFVILSQDKIELASKESKDIIAFVNVPKDKSGSFQLTLNVKSFNRLATSTVNLNVEPCFNYNLFSAKDFISLCDHSTEVIKVDIKNDGSVKNTYKLELDAPPWIGLDNNLITVDSKDEESVNLIVSPDYKIQGDFNINLKAVTERGDVSKIKNIKVNVKSCNTANIDIEKSSDRICNSLSNSYSVIVRNAGEVNNKYKVSLSGPGWATLKEGTYDIKAGGEESLNLNINPGTDVGSGTFKINVKAEIPEANIVAEDSIDIETVSVEECYKPNIKAEQKLVEVGKDSTLTVPIVVENKGTNKATYTLGVSGNAANFVQLNPGVVTIEPGKAEVVYLYVAPSAQEEAQGYTLSINARLEDTTILSSDEIRIKVSEEKVEEVEVIPPLEGVKGEELGKVVDFSGVKVFLSTYKLYIIVAVIILILLILFFRSNMFRSIIKFFEEEEVVEEKPKEKLKKEIKKEIKKEAIIKEIEKKPSNFWRYILILIVIAAIVYLIRYTLIWDYVLVYKWYFIIGLVILILLWLFTRRGGFKSLIEFFEEEEVPEDKAEKIIKEKAVKKEKKIVEKKVIKKEEPVIEDIRPRGGFWWKFILFIIIVAALIYLFKYKNLWGYIVTYKWFVITGIVILIVLIFLVNKGKGIMKFFMEDEEETKEKKKKSKEEETNEYY